LRTICCTGKKNRKSSRKQEALESSRIHFLNTIINYVNEDGVSQGRLASHARNVVELTHVRMSGEKEAKPGSEKKASSSARKGEIECNDEPKVVAG